ncbi:hypothetical protein R5R35_012617 [Gryllus longicercus]|uniref:Uncharacterized protein n=1 Tax=Gryllus longicercus TaxID=2509291 RepID=A0AAN9VDR3_9ORTH
MHIAIGEERTKRSAVVAYQEKHPSLLDRSTLRLVNLLFLAGLGVIVAFILLGPVLHLVWLTVSHRLDDVDWDVTDPRAVFDTLVTIFRWITTTCLRLFMGAGPVQVLALRLLGLALVKLVAISAWSTVLSTARHLMRFPALPDQPWVYLPLPSCAGVPASYASSAAAAAVEADAAAAAAPALAADLDAATAGAVHAARVIAKAVCSNASCPRQCANCG